MTTWRTRPPPSVWAVTAYRSRSLRRPASYRQPLVHERARNRDAPDAAESIAMPCATIVRYTWYSASSGRRSVLTTTPSSADAAEDGLTRVGSPTQAEQAKAASDTSKAARIAEPHAKMRSARMVDRPTRHRVRRGTASGFAGAPSASASHTNRHASAAALRANARVQLRGRKRDLVRREGRCAPSSAATTR